MRLTILSFFFIFSTMAFGQNKIAESVHREYDVGHFNGSILYIDENDSIKINKGYANFQFQVKINNDTRFPIASMTKLFTTVCILQLQEKGLIHLEDKVGKYIQELPVDCKDISIKELLLHQSGLENEPIKAVVNPYTLDGYISNFVKIADKDRSEFNYNNVDYVLLSKVIENSTKKPFSVAIEDLILKPLSLVNSGFVKEEEVILDLAYGYHNYSFGEGKKEMPLYNDRRFISNYYGAGGMYSTIDDLYKFVIALRDNKLINQASTSKYLLTAQTNNNIDWLLGKPTYGFFFNEAKGFYRRGGSIDGFNTEMIIDKNFNKIMIILCNTDTADLPLLATKLYLLTTNNDK